MPLVVRVTRIDKLGRKTPVKLRWNERSLASFIQLAESQGIKDELWSKGQVLTKFDAFIEDADIKDTRREGISPEGNKCVYLGYEVVDRKSHHLKAGTMLEAWRQ